MSDNNIIQCITKLIPFKEDTTMQPKDKKTGTRQTFYLKTFEGMKKLADEEQIEVNGATFEDLFWCEYSGGDKNYTRQITRLYNGEQNFVHTLQNMTELMAYSEGYMKKENIEFLQVVRDAIGSSGWTDEDVYKGDYHVGNREFQLDQIFDIFHIITDEINRNIELAETPLFKEQGKKPWEIPASDNRRKELLRNASIYSEAAIESLLQKEKVIRAELDSGVTPGRALDLIIENWEYLWNYTSTYEAVEYCIVLSRQLTDKPLIRKKLRQFTKRVSSENQILNIIVKSILRENETENTTNRLLKYSELFQSLRDKRSDK